TLLSITAIIAITQAYGQDRIYTRNGGLYEVKIKEVGLKTVIYKKWNNQEGPDYVLPKQDVEKIKFQNGDEETFGMQGRINTTKQSREKQNEIYGKNMLSLSPIHMTNVGPVGFGIS